MPGRKKACSGLTKKCVGDSDALSSVCEDSSRAKKMESRVEAMLDIMRHFDFDKVVDVCEYLKWEVFDSETGGMAPVTTGYLIRSFEEMVRGCWKAFDSGEADDEWVISGGPLKIWWCECNDGIFAELEFVCTGWRYEPFDSEEKTK